MSLQNRHIMTRVSATSSCRVWSRCTLYNSE